MKSVLSNIFFGRDVRVSGLIAFCAIALIGLGCSCGKNLDFSNLGSNSNSGSASNDSPFSDDNGEMPGDALLKALVKETTADFSYAISSEDFSGIYSKASSDFQSTYTETEMKNVFKSFIEKKKVILPILAKTVSMDPEFSPAPSIRTEQGLSILVANGKYATKPIPVRFEYEYVKRGGTWKLLKLIIKLT